MIKKLVFIFFVSVFSAQSFAEILWKFPVGSEGGPTANDPYTAIFRACRNVLLPIFPDGDFLFLINGSTFNSVGNTLIQADPSLGTTTSLQCCTGGGTTTCANTTVTKIQTCQANQPAQLLASTTIASFATNGDVVPADYPVNPQCVDKCLVSHPGGTGTGGVAYSALGVQIAVGTDIWVVFRDSITQSGETCNYQGADVVGITSADETMPPLDQLNDLSGQTGNSGGSTGGGSSGGGLTSSQESILNSIYSNTQSASTKLDNIDSKVDSLLALAGTSTGDTGDGSPIVIDGGTFGTMPQPPIAEVPAGGLVAPSETGLNSFKTSIAGSSERDAGTCPTWTFHIALLASTSTHGDYKFDQHCALVDSHRGALQTVMTVVWSVAALALVFKA